MSSSIADDLKWVVSLACEDETCRHNVNNSCNLKRVLLGDEGKCLCREEKK